MERGCAKKINNFSDFVRSLDSPIYGYDDFSCFKNTRTIGANYMYMNPAIMRTSMGYLRSMAAAALFVPVVVAAQPVGAADLTGSTHIAAQGPASTQGLGLQVGYNSDYRRATLAYETPKLWVYQFQNGWGRVDLNIELGVSYWEAKRGRRSEEHTSELQSLMRISYAVFCLKKKTRN